MARVRKGPAFATPPARVLALPASCHAPPTWGDAEGGCRPAHAQALEGAARMSLEFAGYSLVDSALVNRHMRWRREHTRQDISGPLASESHQVDVTGGAAWDDASPGERARLLRDLGVDGFLTAAIQMGPTHGLNGQRTVQVRLRVISARGNQLVWSSRCSVETGTQEILYRSTEQAVELATRCALESAALF